MDFADVLHLGAAAHVESIRIQHLLDIPLRTLALQNGACDLPEVHMRLRRWKFRDDSIVSQFQRQLAVGLITGGGVGMALMPTDRFYFGALPVVIGVYFALVGLMESTGD